MVAPSPREVFLDLVHKVADGRWAELPELYAEATDVAHPFDPLGSPPLRTREQLREHFGPGPSLSAVRRTAEQIVLHETTDPEVVIGEFEYHFTVAETGASFSYPCIFVLRVHAGEIVESRDYIDHLGSARAHGRLDQLIAAIQDRELRGSTRSGR